MGNEQTEAFRGHIGECFRDLITKIDRAHPKGSKGASQAREPIAHFCKVQPSSVARWVRTVESLPVGEVLIKLICYLNLMGYKVIETERMVAGRRSFMELVGFNLLSMQEAATLLHYSSTSTLFQVLLGHQGTSEERDQKMWSEWKARMVALDAAKQEARRKYWLPVLGEIPVSTPARIQSRLQTTISIMQGLLGLLEEDPLGSLSQEAIRRLPQETVQTVVRLSGALNSMAAQVLLDRHAQSTEGEKR